MIKMVNLDELITKPNLCIPIHLTKINSAADRNRIIDTHLLNIINWAIARGYDPSVDYVSIKRAKVLVENSQKEASYKKRFDEVVTEINAEGEKMIKKRFVPVDMTVDVGRKLDWDDKIIHEEFDRLDNRHAVVTTPDKVCERLFAGLHSMFDANPVTQQEEFCQEAFEKLSGRIFSELIVRDADNSHRFEIRLDWKV